MKIFSISRIKNEEDIIESFVRYHLNFIDEMVIIEDYSNDETYNILKKLKTLWKELVNNEEKRIWLHQSLPKSNPAI